MMNSNFNFTTKGGNAYSFIQAVKHNYIKFTTPVEIVKNVDVTYYNIYGEPIFLLAPVKYENAEVHYKETNNQVLIQVYVWND